MNVKANALRPISSWARLASSAATRLARVERRRPITEPEACRGFESKFAVASAFHLLRRFRETLELRALVPDMQQQRTLGTCWLP
jgi:hypothetical protein